MAILIVGSQPRMWQGMASSAFGIAAAQNRNVLFSLLDKLLIKA